MYAREFEVESDNKPLKNIFRKPISEITARIARLLMQLQKYDFKEKYMPGKKMYVSDMLSRMNLPETEESIQDIDINQLQLNAHLPMSPQKYNEFKSKTSEDGDMQSLRSVIENGWLDKKYQVQWNIREYWSFRDELTCADRVLYKGLKIIIPKQLRKGILNVEHSTHQDIMSCKEREREFMFWVGMMKEIQDVVERCEICARNNRKANHKEPLISSEIPDRPSTKVGAVLFELNGCHYLLTVDYYSKWPEVKKLDNLSSSNVLTYLKKQFSRFGYINELVTDNGPQFPSAEFKKFAKDYQFIHTTSSPHYSQSMGQTERHVQSVKNLIKKSSDHNKALLDYRITPLDGVYLSPAQLHFGRRIKCELPKRTELLTQQEHNSKTTKNEPRKRQQRAEHYYNKHSGKPLSELHDKQAVMISHNNQMVPGKVVKKHQAPRSYIVETIGGTKLRRNRRHLKATRASFQALVLPGTGNSESSREQAENGSNKLVSNQYDTSAENQPVKKSTSCVNQPEQQQEIPTTRSGRAVIKPAEYSDYVCNSISAEEYYV